jgi:hypothetical protein
VVCQIIIMDKIMAKKKKKKKKMDYEGHNFAPGE